MSGPPHDEADRPGVAARFIASFALGYVGLWVALLTPSLGTLTIRVRQIDAAHAAELLARVLALGADAAAGYDNLYLLAGTCALGGALAIAPLR